MSLPVGFYWTRETTTKPKHHGYRRTLSSLQHRLKALGEVEDIHLPRHRAEEPEGATYGGDRLCTHGHHTGQYAEGEVLVVAE